MYLHRNNFPRFKHLYAHAYDDLCIYIMLDLIIQQKMCNTYGKMQIFYLRTRTNHSTGIYYSIKENLS